ncbi:hypothetical protein OZX57_06420 [Bifidobacterium sp. ESL0682]|uniref:hypothetical protein n=1 Tax=Bifidobacterium sp. ESL0682 TaxID=2983212 RepID=UPI0023F88685|nr:hypothetical protein [Bifidobacterium sp. ESL0682]WEV41620.1 hypothetical protein OZX57_06420 [Bifidobacterium sp. ESL0682]
MIRQLKSDIEKTIGHEIQKHDLNLTDDLYIIKSDELDQLCREAAQQILKQEGESEA